MPYTGSTILKLGLGPTVATRKALELWSLHKDAAAEQLQLTRPSAEATSERPAKRVRTRQAGAGAASNAASQQQPAAAGEQSAEADKPDYRLWGWVVLLSDSQEGQPRRALAGNRMTLASWSDTLCSMLCNSSFAESSQVLVVLPEVDFSLLSTMVEALYKSKLELSMETVEPMLVLAERLQVPLVVDACHAFLEEKLDKHAEAVLPHIFCHCNSGGVREAALQHITECFLWYEDSELLQHLRTYELVAVLDSDDLVPSSERRIIISILKYVTDVARAAVVRREQHGSGPGRSQNDATRDRPTDSVVPGGSNGDASARMIGSSGQGSSDGHRPDSGSLVSAALLRLWGTVRWENLNTEHMMEECKSLSSFNEALRAALEARLRFTAAPRRKRGWLHTFEWVLSDWSR